MTQWRSKNHVRVVHDYYAGFEGHPELQFVAVYKTEAKAFRMWMGWFDDIMNHVLPKGGAWTSLALLYHLEEGWFEKSPWHLVEVAEAIIQLQVAYESLLRGESKNICAELIAFLQLEHRQGAKVFIDYS